MEAQLAQITVDDLRAHTDRMEVSGVPVWWPTSSDSAWIGEVHGLTIFVASQTELSAGRSKRRASPNQRIEVFAVAISSPAPTSSPPAYGSAGRVR
ncbi:hypothetical protein [Actinopolymorpha pittospori]|uniref:Uncharacterized protein n=1 Tax=Actinopolymorpha pittospori TaxID=648752 RepID=A0A927RIN3_9ACTN|nr:hypothetical protein [Actinopolymorpha pittospori]MBE1604743.1 hypothetical protein [Actinopolymorpha pittospori]